MSRRFKLITSIASLTAAVALLMFGVFAAGLRSVAVNGTLTFTATNVSATITVYEKHALTVDTTTPVDSYVFSTTGSQNVQSSDDITLAPQLTDDDYAYSYLVVVKNDFATGGANVAVSLTAPTDPAYAWLSYTSIGGATNPETSGVGKTAANTTIAAQGTYYWLFTYVVDPTKAPQTQAFDVSSTFALARA